MRSSNFYWLAFFIAVSGMLSGCCGVPTAGCGSCGVASTCRGACPGLLHGELAARVRDAITGGCCSGCGEVYYDEQINEPPTCDPCSGNGEFTGSNCGPCRPLCQRLRDLWCSPCTTACGGCDSGGSDMYATANEGSGYCPNCRDGVAGNPTSQVQHHTQRSPAKATPLQPQRSSESSGVVPKNSANPSLEPIPDPVSDAPSRFEPVKAERSSTSRQKPSRTIQVPAVQAKHTR